MAQLIIFFSSDFMLVINALFPLFITVSFIWLFSVMVHYKRAIQFMCLATADCSAKIPSVKYIHVPSCSFLFVNGNYIVVNLLFVVILLLYMYYI